jgi:hypothetical protein
MKRRIVIDIDTTINRHKFDISLFHVDDVVVREDVSRADIHDAVRKALNETFDSMK